MPKLYTQEDFDNAIAAIKCGLSYRKASMQFGVPKSTLTDRIAGGKHKRQEQIFSRQEEEGFVEYFHQLSQRECGLTSLEVRNIIKCWLDRGHRVVSRFKENMPTSNWVTQFKKRHPTLNIKPLKTVKPVKIKIEGRAVEHLNDMYDEKVSPDSTQESLMEEDDLSHKDQDDMTQELTSRSIPEMDETITTVVRPISPLVINHEILDSNERNFSSSSMERTSPQSISCQSSPPIVVHQNIETISLADTIKSISNKSLKSRTLDAIANRNLKKSHSHERMEPRVVQPCSSSSNMNNSNGTPSDMLSSKNYIALKALEDTLTDEEKNMFYRRFEEPHSLEIDVLYIAWKVLKHRCANDESPTMVNCNMRYRKEYSPFVDKTNEHIPNPVAEETMLQLQEIINKYQEIDDRKSCDEDNSGSVTEVRNRHCRDDDSKSSIVNFDNYRAEDRKPTVEDMHKYNEDEDKQTSVIVANSVDV